MGALYLLGDRLKEGYYKIGVTRGDLEKRIKKLQTGNAGEIYVVDSFETKHPFILEKMIHNSFFNDRELGEWYKLSHEEVVKFQEYCEKKQKDIDLLLENNYFFKKNFSKTN